MNKLWRLIVFLICLAVIISSYFLWKSTPLPRLDIKFIILSSLVLLSFVTLFIEHFFTKPTDVIASTLSILLLLTPLRDELIQLGVWYDIFYIYNLVLLTSAWIALLLLDEQSANNSTRNKVSYQLKNFAVRFGNGKLLYFALFALSMLFYVDSQSDWFLILFAYAAIIVLIDPKKFVYKIFSNDHSTPNAIGKIFGVQSKNTFLVRLFDKRNPVKRFDFVEFKYSIDKSGSLYRGLIIDNYLLNKEQWVKVLVTPDIRQAFHETASNIGTTDDIVCQMDIREPPSFLTRLVGVVMEGSTISKIRFEYGGKAEVFEGTLLELFIGDVKVLYQVVQGITDVELLENKNEAGLIVGEAVQLGKWMPESTSFEKFGWVPEMNTPVYLAGPVDDFTCAEGELQVGSIPNTNCPVILKKQDMVSHHMAILGVTGSGKSVFSRNLMRQLITDQVKIICVDFTNEYRDKMDDVSAGPIITDDSEEKIFRRIDILSTELSKFANQQNKETINSCETSIQEEFSNSIRGYLQNDNHFFTVFELPDVSNTTGILEYTKSFFQALFKIAKDEGNHGRRVCVVLEEAHTVIPEWNFIGVSEKTSQSLVNSIGQIALQGRKYNIGFIVIAQRTANVSKTVLTQCNSVIAFQQFDKTSADFLTNYMGTDMVAALPNLGFRQAVAVGKAFKANMPIIFEVPEINETC
jgi:hypothetical protein